MIRVRKRGRTRVHNAGELQNPSPFRVCRDSLYPVHMLAAIVQLKLRYSVLSVPEYYSLDVTMLNSIILYISLCAYMHRLSFMSSLSIHLPILFIGLDCICFIPRHTGNNLEHKSLFHKQFLILSLVDLIFPDVRDPISAWPLNNCSGIHGRLVSPLIYTCSCIWAMMKAHETGFHHT